MMAVVSTLIHFPFPFFCLLLLRCLVFKFLKYLMLSSVLGLVLSSTGQNLIKSFDQFLTRLPTAVLFQDLPEVGNYVRLLCWGELTLGEGNRLQ
jgi:hypothetical protein